jgi:hypothetical protein
LDEENFMEQPEAEGYEKDAMLVCRLKWSIYGLKQSARQWNRTFDSFFLTRYNLVASSADSCVCHSDGHVKIVTGIFVDDGTSCSIDESKLTDMLQYLRKHFEVRKELATTALVLTCSAVATPAVFSSTSNDT